MDGFIQAAAPLAQRGGRHHADGAGDLAGFIGEDVPEHILGDDDVELRGVFADLHGGVVDEHLAVFDVGVFGRQPLHDGAPQAAGVQHVGLVDAGKFFAALARGLEADAADALDLVLGVGHDVDGDFFAVLFKGLVLAKIDAADQLAHDDKVDAFGDDLVLERAGGRQLRPDLGRAAVGVQPHAGAQAQQAFFGAFVAGQPLPFGAADGAQQHAVGRFAFFQFRFGQRVAEFVDGFAAHVGAGVGEGMAVFGGDLIQHAHSLGDDLGAGAVAVDQGDVFLHRAHLLRRCPAGCSSARRPQ